MVRINHIYLINNGLFLILTALGVSSQTSADEALGSTIDCSEVAINYIDRPDMTHNERLEAMDRAFFESVNRFELCHLSNQSSSSQASSSSESASAGSDAATGGAESSESGVESVASPLMTGTETESSLPLYGSPENSGMPEITKGEPIDGTVAIYAGSGGNGALPEDIPAANNDDAVAAQIRLAAEVEKDPMKKEKLWNEYRKYKGLPVKGNEE
jgi:hypothetical protein